MKTITVIGGGASGLVAAIYAKTSATQVILLERNSDCGKKILATGNGRCNYWNSDQDLKHYNSSNKSFLENIITDENKEEIMIFFNRIGIIPKIKNGYYYPYSNQAVSIKNALITEARRLGVQIYNDTYIDSVRRENNKFIINYNKKSIISDSVIVATGSKAAPKTGSDGNGYDLVKKFSHSVIEVLPALVQLRGQEKYFKDWAGIRSDVKISLYSSDDFIKKEEGEIQLTDYGISGICTFNLSRFVSRNLYENKNNYVIINFLPFLEQNKISFFEERNELIKGRTLLEFLEGLLNNKLVKVLLNIININSDRKWQDLKYEEKEKLVEIITNFKLEITGTNSFEQAQVCSGGVPLSEIKIKTMESIYQENLYIVGELLDVDGDCGGYNLSFAWISGMLAGLDSRR